MFVEISKKQTNQMEITTSSYKKPTYSIKKLLKQLFKKCKSPKVTPSQNVECTKKAEINEAFESLESLDNTYMTDIEYDCDSMASYKNDANESFTTKAASCDIEVFELSDISTTIPVHYIRNEHGTFFWTATNDIPADNDLVEPLCCSTNNQLAYMQDRWTHV